MTNEYTNLYDWCDSRQGQTLDNRHKSMWEEAGKLILSIHNMNIEIKESEFEQARDNAKA